MIRNASSCVFKKKLIDPANYEFAYFRYCGDWQFWADLAGSAWKVAYINKRLNYFRIHDQNVSTEAEKKGLNFREGFIILDRILKREKIMYKNQIFRYWGLKLYETVFLEKKISWYIKIRIILESLLTRYQIFWYMLWNHKTKIKLKKLLWQ